MSPASPVTSGARRRTWAPKKPRRLPVVLSPEAVVHFLGCVTSPRQRGDKVTRWRSFPAQAEAGNVDVLRGEWNREWFDEPASAPFSAHDDQADSAAGAFTELALGKHGGGAVRLAGW